MTLCEWRGSRLVKQVVSDPSMELVEAAVRRLDNARFNDLYLEPLREDPETWLCIGGGAGRYLLSGALAGGRFPILVDPTRSAEHRQALVIGGQEGTYPANQVHDLDTALAAVRCFWLSGRFESEVLNWLDT
jgi:hypothetical protein